MRTAPAASGEKLMRLPVTHMSNAELAQCEALWATASGSIAMIHCAVCLCVRFSGKPSLSRECGSKAKPPWL